MSELVDKVAKALQRIYEGESLVDTLRDLTFRPRMRINLFDPPLIFRMPDQPIPFPEPELTFEERRDAMFGAFRVPKEFINQPQTLTLNMLRACVESMPKLKERKKHRPEDG